MMPLIQQAKNLGFRFLEIDIWAWMPYITAFFLFIQKYVYNDWSFLISLGVLMFLDLVTGVWKAIKNKNAVTSIGLRDTAIKLVQYGVFLITIHVLISFQVNGKIIGVLNYADECGYSFLILIEAKSIFENLQVIDQRFDFSGIIDKIKTMIPVKK